MQREEGRIGNVRNGLDPVNADFWLRLDNAAKIYPAIESDEMTAVFRLSAALKTPVKIGPFLKAIDRLEQRFPYYKMKPRRGFFWHYLQLSGDKTTVVPDRGIPCRSFNHNELIFRVLVRGNKVSVEFSHILCDASGGFEFLRSLLTVYFIECNLIAPTNPAYLQPGTQPSSEEFEDSFAKYFQTDLPGPQKIPKSFHLPFPLKTKPRFTIILFQVRIAEIMRRSKELKVSITVFLVGVYLLSLQNIHNSMPSRKRHRARKIFRIQVPVNLRNIFPSKTMRNFSLYVTPEIDLRLGQYTFDEILKIVYHKMQLETDKKLISKIMSRNVGAERNILLKNTPLFIKSIFLHFTYRLHGTSRYSGVITNLGKVSLQEEADKLIDYFVFIPPPPNKTLKVNCGVIGFADKLVLSFGNITTSRALEREFIRTLTREGIPVKIIDHYDNDL